MRSRGDTDAAKITIAATTRELIEDAWTAAYWIPAQVTGVKDVELSAGEARILAERSEAVIKSLGTKRAKQTLNFLDKYAPGVSLAVAAAIITMPRIRAVQHAKAARGYRGSDGQVAAQQGGSSSAARGDQQHPAPASGGGADSAVGHGQQPATSGYVRPVTAADLDEFRTGDAF